MNENNQKRKFMSYTALGSELKTPAPETGPSEVKPPTIKEEQMCDCSDSRPDSKITAFEAEQYIAFENELHNIIYIK